MLIFLFIFLSPLDVQISLFKIWVAPICFIQNDRYAPRFNLLVHHILVERKGISVCCGLTALFLKMILLWSFTRSIKYNVYDKSDTTHALFESTASALDSASAISTYASTHKLSKQPRGQASRSRIWSRCHWFRKGPRVSLLIAQSRQRVPWCLESLLRDDLQLLHNRPYD